MFFNFRLFRLRRRPVIHRQLSWLAVVVRPPRVIASSAACSPRIIGYRSLAQQHRRRHRHCVLILPPPSLVTPRAVHRPLSPQPTTVVDRPLRSSRFFIRHLLSFSSSPVRCLHRSSSLGLAKGGGWMPLARSLFRRSNQQQPVRQ